MTGLLSKLVFVVIYLKLIVWCSCQSWCIGHIITPSVMDEEMVMPGRWLR